MLIPLRDLERPLGIVNIRALRPHIYSLLHQADGGVRVAQRLAILIRLDSGWSSSVA